jgi:hypothetical protein
MMEKGWEEEDIAKAEDILYSEEKQDKHYGYLRDVNPIIYWMGLLVAIIGNMIISVFLIPFFLVLTSIQLYVIIGTMGLVFGAMFNFLLRDIEHVDYKHHVVAGVFIPIIAAVTIFVVVTVANTFARIMQSSVHQNVGIIVFVYIITFSTPYLIYKAGDVKSGNKHKETVSAKAALQSQPQGETSAEGTVDSAQPQQSTPEYSSPEEAWTVYQRKQAMEQQRVQQGLTDKYKKYL